MLIDVTHVATDLSRYARQVLLPGVGPEGQERLGDSRVAVVGAGGLGSPVLAYLVAAGVGEVVVIDPDTVDLTNLHRQVLHDEASVGDPKVSSAVAALGALNSGVRVTPHPVAIDASNALDLLTGCDVVVDATDSFAARYAANDAAVILGVPVVWAAIDRFAGQVSVFWAGRGPCYRCIFPAPPPPGSVATCAEAGVLGALPGVMGSVQAVETLKLLLRAGEPLLGRLQCYDALAATWSQLPVRRDPDCPVCASVPSVAWQPEDADAVPLTQVAELTDFTGLLLDVRTDAEWAAGHLPGARHLPLDRLLAGAALPGAPDGQPVLAYCQAGTRSAIAVRALKSLGVTARSLEGGYAAWQAADG